MSETTLRLVISGRVQGVGYRWAMVAQARKLGLCGWVRNRRDGSVEALVAGAAEAVDSIVRWARQGPEGAAVSEVEMHPAQGSFDAFEQWPTV